MTTTAIAPEAQTAAEAVTVTIATHPGVFHCDDAMACAILRHLMPHALIDRTADPKQLEAATYVVDIGGTHDPKTGRYDHHQPGAPVRPDGSPYAAAGLVWAVNGRVAVLATLTGEQVARLGRHIDLIAEAVDVALIRHVDAADNGKRVDGYTISQMVAGLNPVWGELDTPVARQVEFAEAVWLCQKALVREIKRQAAFHLTAQLVSDAWDDSPRDTYPGILLLERFIPWQDAVANGLPEAKLVVFPSLRGGWNVQVIEKWAPDGTKTVRCPLPDYWHGLTGADLEKASEIAGATFCHKGGFIAAHGASKPGGAMHMASIAITSHLSVEEYVTL